MLGRINETRARMDEDEEFCKELVEGHPSGNPITLGPRLPSPEEWAKLQVKGAQDNAGKWLDRTTAPKKNFKEEALRATSVDRYHDSMSKVLSEKRWEGGMALVDEGEAIAIIKKRGSGVYSSGVADRADKIKRVVKDLHTDRLALCSTIDDMPVSTDAEREAKMLANKRGLEAIGKKRRGG
jgi:hypothetical protein